MKSDGVFYAFIIMILFFSGCTFNTDNFQEEQPEAVDLSKEAFFPPISGPQGGGDCTCWSTCYYYNTYMQARDEFVYAANGDISVVNSVRFMFGLIAQGSWGAENTRYAMERLSDIGCSNEALHPYGENWETDDFTRWPTRDAWIQALNNRTGALHKIRVHTTIGLEAAKQVLAGRTCLVTRGDFGSNYFDYGENARGVGIDNRVMYRRDTAYGIRHSICIVGYDDTREYIDDRDGQLYSGAFLLANSEGQEWGWYNSTKSSTRGFIWMSYSMFLNREFGYYNWENIPESPGFDNEEDPTVYYHDDRPSYRPLLYAAAGINHPMRNMITFTGGIGSTTSPDFTGPVVLEYTEEGGDFDIDDSKPVVIDLTDGVRLINSGKPGQVFIQLSVHHTAVTAAEITSMSVFYDTEGDGMYEEYPSYDPVVSVSPGDTTYVTAEVNNPG